ncbi:MAG TPA: hypothetical protein VES60_03240 [Nakamurella sp.]|nr:hypothetical protein [Nakamurella sp.]
MVPNRVSAAGGRLPSPKRLSKGLGPNPTVMVAVARGPRPRRLRPPARPRGGGSAEESSREVPLSVSVFLSAAVSWS